MLSRVPDLCSRLEVASLVSPERAGAVQEKGRQVIIGGSTLRRRNAEDQGP